MPQMMDIFWVGGYFLVCIELLFNGFVTKVAPGVKRQKNH
jgi:hypothetical protein